MLRVQSLHLPREGLGSALSAKTIIGNIFPKVNKILPEAAQLKELAGLRGNKKRPRW